MYSKNILLQDSKQILSSAPPLFRNINSALAFFFLDLFSLCERPFVTKLIRHYCHSVLVSYFYDLLLNTAYCIL